MKTQIVHKNNSGDNISIKREMADILISMFLQPIVIYILLRDIIVEIKAYLHYETQLFESNKQMKLIFTVLILMLQFQLLAQPLFYEI